MLKFSLNPVEIVVFPSPTGYMLTSFGFLHKIEVYSMNFSKMICDITEILTFNQLFSNSTRSSVSHFATFRSLRVNHVEKLVVWSGY